MAAFTSLTTFKAALATPKRRTSITGSMVASSVATSAAAGIQGKSAWLVTPAYNPGVAPGTGAAVDNTTAGAWVPEATDTGTLFLGEITAALEGAGSSSFMGYLLIYDRLVASDGLSGNLNTLQTTNLPTTALPARAPANGQGCFAFLEIYSQIGVTGTTVTVTYKNTAGSAHTCPVVPTFGGSGFREAGNVCFLSLQSGDTGFKTVESVTLTAASGTPGSFGAVIGQPLAMIAVGTTHVNPAYTNALLSGMLQQLPNGACISGIWLPTNTVTTNPQLLAELSILRGA